MVAALQVNLFMRHKDGPGWSEGYHYLGALGITDPIDIRTLANMRAGFLTSDVTITHARVATGVKRQVQIISLNGGAGYTGALTPPTAPLETAILFVFQGASPGFNRLFARGFDRASVDGETLTPSAPLSSAAGLWENYLQTAGLYYVHSTAGSPTTTHKVTSLSPTPPRGISFTSPDNLGPIGTIISLHGTKVPGYAGRKTITSFTSVPPNFNYTAGGAAPATADTGTNITATVLTETDQAITTVTVDKITRRGPGRPFGLSAGRRRTTYSLRQ